MNDDRLSRLAGKFIGFQLRPPTGRYRTFFTPDAVATVDRLLGHGVPRLCPVSTEPYPNAEDRALHAFGQGGVSAEGHPHVAMERHA